LTSGKWAVTSTLVDDLAAAESLLDVGRWRDAQRLLGEYLGKKPQSAQGWCLLARCCAEAGAAEEMRMSAAAAISYDPNLAEAHRLHAYGLMLTGNPVESVLAAKETVRLAPDQWTSLLVLATANRVSNQYQAGITACQHALWLAPEEPTVHVEHGILLADLAQPDAARAAWRRALDLDPTNAEALARLASDDAAVGSYGQAAAGFGAAAAEQPERAGTSERALEEARNILWYATDAYLVAWAVVISGLSIAFGIEPGQHGPIHDPPPFVRLALGTGALVLATFAARWAFTRTPVQVKRLLMMELRRRPYSPALICGVVTVVALLAVTYLPRTNGRLPELVEALVLIPLFIGFVRFFKRLSERLARRSQGERGGVHNRDLEVVRTADASGVPLQLVEESIRRPAVDAFRALAQLSFVLVLPATALRLGHLEALLGLLLVPVLVLPVVLMWRALPPAARPIAWQHVRGDRQLQLTLAIWPLAIAPVLVPQSWIGTPVWQAALIAATCAGLITLVVTSLVEWWRSRTGRLRPYP
jgi:tetratricopeptide (TPR) repeat protein